MQALGSCIPPDRFLHLHFIRSIWGCFLGLAAGSRLLQQVLFSATDPLPLWTVIGQITLACWFLIALLPKHYLAFWDFLILLALSSASVLKAYHGRHSCGCFGLAVIDPWVTSGFALFAAFVTLICFLLPLKTAQDLATFRSIKFLIIFVTTCFFAILIKEHTSLYTSQSVAQQPDHWVHQRFPLIGWSDIDQDLQSGDWFVMIHRPGCHRCIEAILSLSKSIHNSDPESSFALLEIPNPGDWSNRLDPSTIQSTTLFGHLSDAKKWSFETPLLVALRDGRVVSVRRP